MTRTTEIQRQAPAPTRALTPVTHTWENAALQRAGQPGVTLLLFSQSQYIMEQLSEAATSSEPRHAALRELYAGCAGRPRSLRDYDLKVGQAQLCLYEADYKKAFDALVERHVHMARATPAGQPTRLLNASHVVVSNAVIPAVLATVQARAPVRNKKDKIVWKSRYCKGVEALCE